MQKKLPVKTLYLILCACLSSCSFRLAPSLNQEAHKTIAIPYVEGDSSGKLTPALIEQVEQHTALRFTGDAGELTLKVKIVDSKTENIGFRFADHTHEIEKLIPNESRSKRLAEVTVIETATQKVLLGPAYILATTDYDHQNYALNMDINRFSLGQLSDIDTTSDILYIPAYRNLARNIADYLQNHLELGKDEITR